jgi:LacI family transcriptional regulator
LSKVTLRDVSAAAGVGMATVSRALGDHPDVSAETRDRVREIAQRLGYRPSVAARALRRGGFHAISVVVPDNGWGWWEPVVHSAFAAASAAGYQMLVHPIAGTAGGVAAVVESLENVPTEGVIVVSVPDQQSVRDACDRIGIPGVAIDDSSPSIHFPTVSPTNRVGARDITTHLITTGRSRIAFIRPSTVSVDPTWGDGLFLRERELGYRDALEFAGIALDDSLLVDVSDSGDGQPGCDELGRLLDSGTAVDAIFCAYDGLASPVLRELSSRGLRIPQDIAVAGFDDERAALLVNPQLTTVRQPYSAMGQAAVDLLLRAIGGDAAQVARHEFDTELIVRGSTSPVQGDE